VIDSWLELGAVLRRNPLRTTLTALGVFWGLLMLILLLGFGEGLEDVAMQNFARRASNSVFLWGGRTSLPHKGQRPGRWVGLRDGDVPALAEVAGVEAVSPRSQLGGWRDGNLVVHGAKTGSYNVMGDVPSVFDVLTDELVSGRVLNPYDLDEQRKVAIIGQQVQRELFGREDPIGELIRVQGVYFTVVGVVRSTRADDRGDRDNSSVHVPLTTFQKAYNQGDRLGWIALTVADSASSVDVEAEAKRVLRDRHGVHPDDVNAIGGHNAQEEIERIENLFGGIRLFIWLVGAATLATGVVGVSNIMLVVVRERTKELGLRRAVGATPWSVMGLILREAVFLTLLAGLVGLGAGVIVVEGTAWLLGPDHELVGNPSLDPQIALLALGVLLISGALAGLLPAQRAARIHPVEALRSE